MTYVPDFRYDVFISYRHADDKFGWVKLLDETLRNMLDEHARPRKDEPPWQYEIFRDNRELSGNQSLPDELQQAVTSSAVLVIVMSENYLATDSDWCGRERELYLAEIQRSSQAAGRIFVVRKSDVAVRDWPAALQKYIGYQFWEADKTSGEIQPMSFDFSRSGRVPTACQRLGDEVWETLDKMRKSQHSEPTQPQPSSAAGGAAVLDDRPVVFLAEVTDELHEARGQFYSFLEQEGFQVVPSKKQQYRFQPDAAEAELPPLIKAATLAVQLHGRTKIPSDEQFGAGIEPWLREQAQAAGKIPGETLLRWRPHETKEEDITDADHRVLVFARDVIAEDLEQFKHRVVDRVREWTQRQSIQVGGSGAKVIVTSRQKETHKPVTDELVDEIDVQGMERDGQPFESAVVYDNATLDTVTREFERQHAPPKAMMVVHADGDEPWVQTRMRECRKYQLSKRPNPPPCAVYVSPPDDQPHPKSVPGRFEVIRHDDKQRLQAFLAQIAAEDQR